MSWLDEAFEEKKKLDLEIEKDEFETDVYCGLISFAFLVILGINLLIFG